MTLLESIARIPLMLYAALLLMPAALYGYMHFSKPRKTIAASAANPADQLKGEKINLRREVYSVIFLGCCLGLGAGMIISFGWLIGDYKNSAGLFAAASPAAAYPPSPDFTFPPAIANSAK